MKKYIILSIGLLSFLILGFFVGQKVQAGTTGPGTISDPLVSKSYIDNLINKIDSLTSRVTVLETQVVTLKKKVDTLSTVKPTTTKTATIITATANIRSGPGSTYKVIKVAKKTNKFIVVSKVSTYWYKIKVTTTTYGYLHSSTVSVK